MVTGGELEFCASQLLRDRETFWELEPGVRRYVGFQFVFLLRHVPGSW